MRRATAITLAMMGGGVAVAGVVPLVHRQPPACQTQPNPATPCPPSSSSSGYHGSGGYFHSSSGSSSSSTSARGGFGGSASAHGGGS